MNDLLSSSFRKYTDVKQQAYLDDVEASKEIIDLNKFFRDVENVKEDMNEVKKLYKRPRTANKECKTTLPSHPTLLRKIYYHPVIGLLSSMARKNFLGLASVCVFLLLQGYCTETVLGTTVTYDGTAIVIDGKRRVLQSGSVHYPRTTPDVWPELIRKSKEGGIDVIETYVFWNYHEPEKGKYYFEGRFDLVKFVKTAQEAGVYVHLRIGPYACAEWNYGGFPVWLHFIPGIKFRTSNKPFMDEMARFLGKIVEMMRAEQLFATQGGPIILAQVENEYGNVEFAYGTAGKSYIRWAAQTAVNLNTTVPWVMCAQSDAPDPIINTCNGFYCDQFVPNSPTKPKMWTENYVGWFLSFGYPIPYRPVEDLVFAVARFFELGGTFQNYYMYFGGTNFGRTAGGPLVATSYDYDAPLDEYGFIRQPKWGHLRGLHRAIKLCEEPLVYSKPNHISLGKNLEAHIYNKSTESCAAFLANYDSANDANVSFGGNSYFLPAWSVSILPDCRTVIYNTAKVVSQRSIREPLSSRTTSQEFPVEQSSWCWYEEQVGIYGNSSFTSPGLLEQINTTKDVSDFLWYAISINMDEKMESGQSKQALLQLQSLGHAAVVFVNKERVGFSYGIHDDPSFSMNVTINLKSGNNSLEILSMLIGLQNYGPFFDTYGAGVNSVVLDGYGNLSSSTWTYQIGLEGEQLGLDKLTAANSSLWKNSQSVPTNKNLIWYKATFSTPKGVGPLSLNLSSMGKGQAWVNGQSIGRYWPANIAPTEGCNENCDYRGTHDASTCQRNCGLPTQTLYHVPRSWLNPEENLLVLHEEIGGDPTKISLLTRTGQEICAHVTQQDPPPVNSLKPKSFDTWVPKVQLECEKGWRITSVSFASFGTPKGSCGTFTQGACKADVLEMVKKECLGQEACFIPVTTDKLGDPCPREIKTLAIEALCSS
ncbi:hypothetical protein MLD38_016766 [Melastoma candidum]|uniref:Uncharacterized protein n=1 Tax=Melastoma candidum TaxID=119954 RepID=A0ACB9QRY3_9MYRT|nr:hypothetical protein MLD38_016766 [Melastoma candidum]